MYHELMYHELMYHELMYHELMYHELMYHGSAVPQQLLWQPSEKLKKAVFFSRIDIKKQKSVKYNYQQQQSVATFSKDIGYI